MVIDAVLQITKADDEVSYIKMGPFSMAATVAITATKAALIAGIHARSVRGQVGACRHCGVRPLVSSPDISDARRLHKTRLVVVSGKMTQIFHTCEFRAATLRAA